jgi:hypothetical protein
MPPAHTLTEMFGLTPAEDGLAIGIAAGRQLAEIAAACGVRIETVLERLGPLTEAREQYDLVLAAASAGVPCRRV